MTELYRPTPSRERNRRRTTTIAALATIALIFTSGESSGCGKGETSSSSSSASSAPTSAPETTAAAKPKNCADLGSIVLDPTRQQAVLDGEMKDEIYSELSHPTVNNVLVMRVNGEIDFRQHSTKYLGVAGEVASILGMHGIANGAAGYKPTFDRHVPFGTIEVADIPYGCKGTF